MSDSYNRKCKFCGRQIQMRRMPHGQWVPFEGYDKVHDCKEPPQRRVTDEWRADRAARPDPLAGLEFKDIDVGRYRGPAGVPHPGPATARKGQRTPVAPWPAVTPKAYDPRPSMGSRRTQSTNWAQILGILVLLFIVFVCFLSQCSS